MKSSKPIEIKTDDQFGLAAYRRHRARRAQLIRRIRRAAGLLILLGIAFVVEQSVLAMQIQLMREPVQVQDRAQQKTNHTISKELNGGPSNG